MPPRKHVAKIQLFFGLEYENQVFLHKIWKFGIKALSLHRKIGKTEGYSPSYDNSTRLLISSRSYLDSDIRTSDFGRFGEILVEKVRDGGGRIELYKIIQI